MQTVVSAQFAGPIDLESWVQTLQERSGASVALEAPSGRFNSGTLTFGGSEKVFFVILRERFRIGIEVNGTLTDRERTCLLVLREMGGDLGSRGSWEGY